MKKLPIGIQSFSELRGGDYLYIDKTEYIYKLLGGKYYFISRARRFGKSLMISTLKEIFSGNKALFEGLWIYDKIQWKARPVIHLDFSKIHYKDLGLEKAIQRALDEIAHSYSVDIELSGVSTSFEDLIQKLSAQGEKVAILVDEYDKPIIDYLENIEQANEHREILKNFYSIIKGNDSHIEFFILTGVSKFSHVSIFSDLNNLNDITLSQQFSGMLGYTQEELDSNFAEEIKEMGERYHSVYSNIKKAIKEWYNGYSWDGVLRVYNPFSVLNLFNHKSFENFWFRTGTPTFLLKLLKKQKFTIFDLKDKKISKSTLDKYDVENLELIPLLFQTGYLTIKSVDLRRGYLEMDFPNKEVDLSFSTHILGSYIDGGLIKADSLLIQMTQSFDTGNMEEFVHLINSFYKSIAYILIEDKEKYYHSIFYTIMRIVGYNIDCEIMTINGRIDAVLETPEEIFVIEFKVNQKAELAIEQIKEKAYAEKFSADKRKKKLLGINFSTQSKEIEDYIIEEV